MLSLGIGVIVWAGAGWMTAGTGAATAGVPGRIHTTTRDGLTPPMPVPPRDRLRPDEQIHQIYLCTARLPGDLNADPRGRSWACFASSGDS